MNRRPKDQRGTGTVLTAGVALALLSLACAAVVVASWFARAVQLQDAADLTVLSAASAMGEGQDPCVQAATAALLNNAVLAACEVRGTIASFVVEVEVRGDLDPGLPGFPSAISRRAAAGSA